MLGVQLLYPQDELGDVYGTSVGISFWRNLWGKFRVGAVEFLGGYQKLRQDDESALFVYPLTTSFVIRAPDRKFRPYVGGGVGMYGWESRIQNGDGTRTLDNGWGPGWTATVGLEYYMRTKVAFDLGVHYHNTSASGGLPGDPGMKFFTVWIGHYVRF